MGRQIHTPGSAPQTPVEQNNQPSPADKPLTETAQQSADDAALATEATKPTQPDAGAIAPVDLSNMSDVDKDAYIAKLQEQLAAAQALPVVPAAAVVQPAPVAPTAVKTNWRLTESGWEH